MTNEAEAPRAEAWCDGACLGNPGVGGWGVLFVDPQGTPHTLSGAEKETTNNRMEMEAAIQTLLMAARILPRNSSLTIHSDSEYLCKGYNLWLANWKIRGWKTAAKKPVRNQDLWQKLETAALNFKEGTNKEERRALKIVWVRGHDGNPGNEHADALALEAAQQYSK
ncbi:MAG: ribonuclease HI [Alphaproteobacteria bacterium]